MHFLSPNMAEVNKDQEDFCFSDIHFPRTLICFLYKKTKTQMFVDMQSLHAELSFGLNQCLFTRHISVLLPRVGRNSTFLSDC